MKKIFLLSLLICFYGISQTSKSIYIYGLTSNEPIPFATILFFEDGSKQNGVYADENGFAKIKLDENTIVEISCLGYERQRISNHNELMDTIFLKSNTMILDEVIVTNKETTKILGFNNEKKYKSINTHKGSEIVVYIKNPNKIDAKIKTVLLGVEKKKDFTVALKIKFYNKNEYNYPADLLINSEIIYYIKERKKGNVEVDISDFNIDFPKEGAFVGVECLGFIDRKGNFIDDNDMWYDFRFLLVDTPENLTFIRNSLKTNTWYNNLKLRLDEVGVKYNNYPNASFGIKVYE